MPFSLSNRPGRVCPCLWRRSILLLLLLMSTVGPASAQEVSLQLLYRAEGPGRGLTGSTPLPSQTTVVVLRHSAERAHTLENAGVSRKALSRRVLSRLRRRDTTLQLGDDGKTPGRYERTARSGEILYVLARTPSDSLYESYVNTGENFVPGFDAVQSGRMTMGPVPPKARQRYQAVFRLRREMRSSSESDSTPQTTTPPETNSGSEERQSGREDPDRAASQVVAAASSDSSRNRAGADSAWMLLLGGILGSLAGGGATWALLSGQLRRAEEDRDELRSELRDVKRRRFREETGATLSDSDERVESASPTTISPDELRELRREIERLCEEIEQLRSENEELQKENEQLREETEQLRLEAEQSRNTSEDSSGKGKQLRKEVEQLRSENGRIRKEKEQLHNENARLREELREGDEDVGQKIEDIRQHLQNFEAEDG